MKPLKERYNLKYLRNKQKMVYQENDFSECFFKVNFYNIPIQERFIINDDFIIINSSAEVGHPVTVPVLLEDGVFKVQFELEGYSKYTDGDTTIEIHEDCFNLFYLPRVNGKLHYKKNRKCVDIMFDKAWFEREVYRKFPGYAGFVDSLKINKPTLLFRESLPIRADIKQLLYSLLSCNLHSDLKSSFYRIKIDELLLLILSCLEEYQLVAPKVTSLSNDEKIIQVKNWIAQQEIGNIRLKEIEELFNVSIKVLNAGFQKYEGCSIAQYLRKLQMEKAFILLKERGYSVNEVSELLRYSYPQHFTTAFTKYFGYSPKELKNS
ncbi:MULTISPECIES: helix-turn-helix transcriptional regulator [Sphingobacterium]|uniref:AraC family transcriptional regulator n=1 Tax=Sphingobacterium ginsenosidimutans TaxID=687845 RepID=A0ABP7ZPZ9_9SPHI|nr:AraC family transcriptional regulator [Sphingobacterium sp. E70]ULT26507.1 AraC family transcriptional regulator [Sphingobacterium sp. E70]